jgi:uncharacterized SAM-binding protein YcdF (DUF218 family)
MISFLESLFRPPSSLIWLALLGLALTRTRWRRGGKILAAGSLGVLYLLATPVVVATLMLSLDRYPTLDPASIEQKDSEAIVILSASHRNAREYGGVTASSAAIERLRYGVWLHQRLERPILITGQRGEYMAQAMEEELGVRPRWVEKESRNTHYHAVYCRDLLRDARIERIYLVTDYWHMPRAMAAFGEAGVEVVPAPMGFNDSERNWLDPSWVLPSLGALCSTSLIFHEWIGRLWYRLRYGH